MNLHSTHNNDKTKNRFRSEKQKTDIIASHCCIVLALSCCLSVCLWRWAFLWETPHTLHCSDGVVRWWADHMMLGDVCPPVPFSRLHMWSWSSTSCQSGSWITTFSIHGSVSPRGQLKTSACFNLLWMINGVYMCLWSFNTADWNLSWKFFWPHDVMFAMMYISSGWTFCWEVWS